jgi:hypothetical protein
MEPRAGAAVGETREAAMMKSAKDQDGLALETLTAVIAHSQIVVAWPARRPQCLPAGFDEIDGAILDWIAAEGRRAGGSFVRM